MRQVQVQTDWCDGIIQTLLKFTREKETTPVAVGLKKLLLEVIGIVIQNTDIEGIDARQVKKRRKSQRDHVSYAMCHRGCRKPY